MSCSPTDDEVAIRETVVIHRDEAKVDADEGMPGVSAATSRSADGTGTLNALADARHAAKKKRDTFSFIVERKNGGKCVMRTRRVIAIVHGPSVERCSTSCGLTEPKNQTARQTKSARCLHVVYIRQL